MPKTRTNEEFQTLAKEKNNKIQVIGTYINSCVPIKVKCNYCGEIYFANPKNVLQNKGHKECMIAINNKKRTLTNDQFLEKLHLINPFVKPLKEYVRNDLKIPCECLICGHVWDVTPNHLFNGRGCPKCKAIKTGDRCRWNDDKLRNELEKNGVHITPLDHYIDSSHKIKFKCDICGYAWEATPASVLRRHSCPLCSSSKGEKRIAELLNKYNIKFIYQKTFPDLHGIGNRLLSYDFYIPSYNLLIEYQGEYHNPDKINEVNEERKLKQIEHDQRKKDYAKNNNLTLLEIWYWEYSRIEEILEKVIKEDLIYE